METAILGRTGLEVGRIGFGGIPIQRLSEEEAVGVVRRALGLGCTLIDTARVYTDSEAKIGTALAGVEELPVLVSKTYSRDADGAREDVDVTLGNLGVEHVDVYLVHNISSVEMLQEVMGSGGAVEGLRDATEDGRVGHLGISSHKPAVLHEALSHGLFEVIEVPFSAIEQESLPLLQRAEREDVGTIVMKPLAGGALENASAAIRFVLEHPVSCVVPGMQAVAEVEEDMAAEGPLTDTEREALLAEAQRWDGRFCRRCEYCLPACPNDINITLTLLFASYLQRYGMTEWPRDRYAAMEVQADACDECGKCEERCPYDLPIREMLEDAHAALSR